MTIDSLDGPGRALAPQLRPPPPLQRAGGTRDGTVAADAMVGGDARRMAQSPPVDAARVEQMKSAIASGAYAIEPERIAEAMLRQEGIAE